MSLLSPTAPKLLILPILPTLPNTLVTAVSYGTKITNFTNFTKITLVTAVANITTRDAIKLIYTSGRNRIKIREVTLPTVLTTITNYMMSEEKTSSASGGRKEPSALKNFLSGGVGGVCTVITGHPLDTIKVGPPLESRSLSASSLHQRIKIE